MEIETFDIETGMQVFGANGQTIGTVTEIAGFGSTHIDHASDPSAGQVTQAQSGTGYLKVARSGKDPLYVPFPGVQEVIPGHGVNLTAAMIAELRTPADGAAQQSEIMAQPRRWGWNLKQPRHWNITPPRRWRVLQPRTWTLRRSQGSAVTVPVNSERGSR